MEFKVSFIGTGNMGGALLHAACRTIDPKRIHIMCQTPGHGQCIGRNRTGIKKLP